MKTFLTVAMCFNLFVSSVHSDLPTNVKVYTEGGIPLTVTFIVPMEA